MRARASAYAWTWARTDDASGKPTQFWNEIHCTCARDNIYQAPVLLVGGPGNEAKELPLRSSQTWLRSVLLDYYVIVCVKMCDDGSPCCSCVGVSTSSVPEVPCSQVDVLDGI